MATVHDPLDYRIGDAWDITGPLQDSRGVPIDLTNCLITWRLSDIKRTQAFIQLSLGSGIIIKNPATGEIRVRATAVQTSSLLPGIYQDSLRVTLADGISAFTEWTGIIRAAPRLP